LGTGFYELTTQKSWMKPSTGKVDVLVMHRDQITTLPEKSQIIAHSQFCPYFMVQHGPNILTIQGHPEFTPEVLQHLTDVNIDNFTANKIREAQATLSAPLDSANILQWMVNFIKMDIPKRKQQYLNVPQKPL
jgi:GMP synthase-like glutamine amidotransferase